MKRNEGDPAEAAEHIANADILIICLGAGMGCDSGLAAYDDIASFEPYKERNLEYHDLCDPDWLDDYDEPNLFFGFWGSCHNNYEEAKPHQGYNILAKWKEHVDSKTTSFTKDIINEYKSKCTSERPIPANSFVYSSNVDHFAQSSGLTKDYDLYEIHGDFFHYQCSKRCEEAKGKLWRIPSNYRFDIDEKMLAIPKKGKIVVNPQIVPKDRYCLNDEQLQNEEWTKKSFETPFPTCPKCLAYARPAILMFHDLRWVSKKDSLSNFRLWEECLYSNLRTNPSKVVIVEVGCGTNVPSVRNWDENVIRTIVMQHRNCLENDKAPVLIRINPSDKDLVANDKECDKWIIPLKMKALEGLKKLDDIIEQKKMDSLY